MGPRPVKEPARSTYHRPPTDHAAHVLLRTVRCVNGEVQLLMECEPACGYGLRRATWQHTEAGYHQTIATNEATSPTPSPTWR